MPRGAKIDADAVLARVLREGHDALLTRGEATALIASRVKDERDDDRSARNRVGTKMDRAAETGRAAHQGGLARMADGRYTADEIAYWANLTYSGVFKDLPCRPRVVTELCSDSFSAADSLTGEVTPGNLKECQRLVGQLRGELRQVLAKHARAEAERKRKLIENFKGK
jgi:hypothetical protein